MNKLVIFKVAFTSVGAVLLALAIWLFQQEKAFLATSEEAVGMIIDFQRYTRDGKYYYHPVIIFEDRALKPYQFVGSGSISNPRTGETVTVLYDPQNPSNAQVATFGSMWGATLVCTLLGLVFFSIGGGLIGWDVYKERQAARLRQHGRHIQAKITGIEENPSIQVNGRNAMRVLATWQDPTSGKTYTFKSRNLWDLPGNLADQKEVSVYLDPDKPGRYAMDLPGQTA